MPVCQRCGYKWKYDGRNKFAYCYRCNKILSKERKLKEKERKLEEIFEEFLEEIPEEIRNNPQKYKEVLELFNKEILDKIVEDEK